MDSSSLPSPESEQDIGGDEQEFVWGDDSFATQEEAETGIANSLAEDLNNKQDESVVTHGDKQYLIEITVKLIDRSEVPAEDEGAGEGGGEPEPIETTPPAAPELGTTESEARALVDRLLG